MPNDSIRDRSTAIMPPARWIVGARQIRSSAPWSSAKTDVAPTSRVTRPTIEARILELGRLALDRRPSTALAPSSPTSPLS